MEKIRAAASSAFEELYEDEGAAISRVAAAARLLDELCRFDSTLAPEIEPLAAARVTLEDLAAFLRNYLGKLEANPERLGEIEDRLALIDRLKRKYGSSVEAILAYAAETRRNLASLEHADERREAVRKDLTKAAAEYRKAAEALSEKRRDAARRLVRLVREELAQLGMEKTRMEVHFAPFCSNRAHLAHFFLPKDGPNNSLRPSASPELLRLPPAPSGLQTQPHPRACFPPFSNYPSKGNTVRQSPSRLNGHLTLRPAAQTGHCRAQDFA